ncbi:MAG: Asp/Glu racemase [Phenylobacterium zucineum]|nr:MAG: Asp/Glu racemase [Phenylobacterium zucineum]
MRIACLHTAASNIDLFESARADLGWPDQRLQHHVRPDLLSAAEAAGGLTAEISAETDRVLSELRCRFPVVLLTCSTLGPVINGKDQAILRADAALADAVVRGGGRVSVLCAAPTTLKATGDLFSQAALATGARIDLRVIDGAWDLFKAGRFEAYAQTIAHAADQALAGGADRVALAQASMTRAIDKVRGSPKPFTSPAAGLAAAGRLAGLI